MEPLDAPPPVDLIINAFERNREHVLAAGFFDKIARQNHFPFRRRILLLNNFHEPQTAERRAMELVRGGEVDEFHQVDRQLDASLVAAGLARRDIAAVERFTGFLLVAVYCSPTPWMVNWDGDAFLEQPHDWITPCIRRMEADSRILVANPAWGEGEAERDSLEVDGQFALGYGFSDQVFLGRRSDFAARIYSEPSCPASLRYPLAHIGSVFEQRVDSYMRHHRRLRATYLPAVYRHPRSDGKSYPTCTPIQSLRRARNRMIVKVLRCLPTIDPRLRV